MNCGRKSNGRPWAGLLLVTVLVLTPHSFAMPATFGARQANNTTPPINNATATTGTSEDEVTTGWMAGPTTRGTLNIIFTCVITLFLCIWTTVQVNIEPPQENINGTLFKIFPLLENRWLGRLLAGRIVRKLGWSCVTIIVPEAALVIAAYERRAAYLLRKAIKGSDPKAGSGANKRWDLTLSYYAIMGGFMIELDTDAAPLDAPQSASSPDTKEDRIAPAVSQAIATPEKPESGVVKKTSRAGRVVDRFRAGENQRRTLTPQGVYLVYAAGMLPKVTPDEVKDKNKASKLTKTIVFFQALWMILQVISRTASRLPVTLIELHTCLHTFCALAMYATWWYKPVDIDLPTKVYLEESDPLFSKLSANDSDDTQEMIRVKEAASPLGEHSACIRYLTSRAGLGMLLYTDLFGDDLLQTKSYLKTLAKGYERLWRGQKKLWPEAMAISFVGLVFGIVHLAAWRNKFPTEAEQMLWRVAAVITAAGWSGFMLSLFLGASPTISRSAGVVFGICAIPCLFVRVYLLVESFISLRTLPIQSYDINVWSELWPHAG